MSKREQALEVALGAILGSIDFRKGCCGLTEMVGATLDVRVLELADAALAMERD